MTSLTNCQTSWLRRHSSSGLQGLLARRDCRHIHLQCVILSSGNLPKLVLHHVKRPSDCMPYASCLLLWSHWQFNLTPMTGWLLDLSGTVLCTLLANHAGLVYLKI